METGIILTQNFGRKFIDHILLHTLKTCEPLHLEKNHRILLEDISKIVKESNSVFINSSLCFKV